jgi:hypothetical protein
MKTPILCALVLMALPCSAMSAVLYKSINANGVVEFSDTPPADPSAVVEARPIGVHVADASTPRSADVAAGSPVYEDGTLARANAQLDLAEHALAEALRAIGSPMQGLRLSAARPSAADAQRIDFFRHNVLLARQNLMEALRSRPVMLDAIASR